ncbi:helix-turn-helix domain-containing protein [Marinobacteraceae bacterium S3BR75-40.1]
MSELGSTLRALREKRSMTLAQLADKAGTYVGNLSRIERGLGKPSLDLLYRISQALGYTLAEVFSVSESHPTDHRQIALNATFIALLEADKDLLLEFAQLLQARASKKLDNVSLGKRSMPADHEEEPIKTSQDRSAPSEPS